MKPILYTFWRSSCAWRVRIGAILNEEVFWHVESIYFLVMALKSIDYESRYVNLEALDQKKPEYKELNPIGMIPTLIIDGKAINDSIAIIELLEVLFSLQLCY